MKRCPILMGTLAIAGALLLAACADTTVARAPGADAAARTSAHFDMLKAERPAELTAFLRAMPKGGDLHNHLSGAVYAESFIAWAVADGLCLDIARATVVAPPCDAAAGTPAMGDAVADTEAYNRLVDAFSVRNYELGDVSGHDQFFATFARFDAAGDRAREGDMLAEAMQRAADQNIAYLELMQSPGMWAAAQLGRKVGWNDDFSVMSAGLAREGLPRVVAAARAQFADIVRGAREKLGCDGDTPSSGCAVTVRFLAQVIRTFPPEQVFAQTALAVALVEQDPLVVGLNFVAPEDDRITLRDYTLQMRMIGALAGKRAEVPVTLHAGELTMGLVPPEDLRFHIREAIEIAGARRIGHGVDILYEDRPFELMRHMAEEGIPVEVNLTSNDVILGVVGDDHPFRSYRAHGVPIVLSTDDEGVSRIDLTHEYVRATRAYDLSYGDVKTFSRNALTYAFLDGDSLWADPARSEPVAACARVPAGSPEPGASCGGFLSGSEKARLQWALEAAFATFEATQSGTR